MSRNITDIMDSKLTYVSPKTDIQMDSEGLKRVSDQWLFDELESSAMIANRFKYVQSDIINILLELKRRNLIKFQEVS
jgi:ABC-type uncharacterized transport system substrate-binding protein|tara:strand:+ start:2470 stop:2703 length:234 start_codon:yes stop_codon:yes gene_type:complete